MVALSTTQLPAFFMPRPEVDHFSWPDKLSNKMELFTLEEIHSYLNPPVDNHSTSHYNGSSSRMFDAYEWTSQILDRYVTTVLCGIGCLGNIVNLIVLLRMRWLKMDGVRENGAQTGLISLALSDMLFCVVLLPRGFLHIRVAVFEKGFWLYYQAYGTWLITTFILTSTWITVVIATLRYVAICHPLLSRRVDRPMCAKICYLTVFLLSILFNLPSMWQFKIAEYDDSLYMIDIGLLDLSKDSGKAYMWLRAVFGIFIPAVVLVFCNFSLISALRRSHKMRRGCYVKKDTTLGMRNRLTAMLIVIAMAFVVFVFPTELMDFFHDVTWKSSHTHVEVKMLVRSVTNVLQVTNFSCNFAIYCTLNVHFRSVLRHLVCFCSTPAPASVTDNLQHSDLDRQWVRLARFNLNGSTKTFVSAV